MSYKNPSDNVIILKKEFEKEKGLFAGIECVTPSKKLAKSFKDGFDDGINSIKQLLRLDPKKLNIQTEYSEYLDRNDKRLEEINFDIDPTIREAFTKQNIDIVQYFPVDEINKISPKKIISQLEINSKSGQVLNNECFTDEIIESEIYCKGFAKGSEIILNMLPIDTSKIKINCIKEQDKDNKFKQKILAGIKKE